MESKVRYLALSIGRGCVCARRAENTISANLISDKYGTYTERSLALLITIPSALSHS